MSASYIKLGPQKFVVLDTIAKFTPQGPIREIGDVSDWRTGSHRENPIKSRTKRPSQGARIILGFNVGVVEKVKMQDVIDLVHKMRRKQVAAAIMDGDAKAHPLGGDIGASFVAQAGLWQDLKDEKAYPENGAQVAIMNIIQEKEKRFEDDMVEIAEEMVLKFHQNAVIVEMSMKGVVEETIEVGPEE